MSAFYPVGPTAPPATLSLNIECPPVFAADRGDRLFVPVVPARDPERVRPSVDVRGGAEYGGSDIRTNFSS